MSSLSDSNLSDTSGLTPELAQQLDELCDAFEQAWKQGESNLAEYLEQGPPECRDRLLTELAAIELDYRRDAYGGRLTLEALGNLYPALAEELEQVARTELASGGLLTPDETPTIVQSTRRDIGGSDRQTQAKDSQGLHIRCPHCREAVEVLDDTELEDVTCRSCGSAFSLVSGDDDAEVPTALPVVGRFELMERVGIGGFGAVWKARDMDLGREVALKIPRKGNLRAAEIDFFFREARAAAQLRHPNIVPVFEIGREGDVVFIVSEFVHGKTLSQWSTTPPQHPKIVAKVAAAVADALEHAHSHGIIHRDLKPSNVMIDELNQPRLMDFGLAKRQTGEITMTRDGQILGTAAYMSPEQARGDSHWTDCRTDIYSLGVMLFQLAIGELPYRGDFEWQILRKQTEDVPELRKFNRHIPKDYSTICLKCLERDPNRRYSTAKEVADELRRFVASEPILARPISRTERLLRWAKRKPALATAASLALFIAVVGPIAAVALGLQNQRIRQQSEDQISTIAQDQGIKQKLGEKNRELQVRIDELLGRVPGIERIAPDWQKKLLEEVLKSHRENLPATETASERAKLHSALGFMYAELDQQEKAATHLREARTALEELLNKSPSDATLKSALAECLAVLADNTSDPNEAETAIARAVELRRELADSPNLESTALFAQLAVELKREDAELQQLKLLESLPKRIVEEWPKDAAGFYEAACRLTLRPAIIGTSTESSEDEPNIH